MKFYDRYINGEGGRTVYNDIYQLGSKAFDEEHAADVQNVLYETLKRVAYNFEIIYDELKAIGYRFKTEFRFNFERPLLKPLPDTDSLLVQLDKATESFGKIPCSLKTFYKVVGACNFGWDYEKAPESFWECADPIQICSLDDIVSEVITDDWKDYLNECLEYDPTQRPYIDLAPDYLHKDNISGGAPYAIELTKEPSVDSLFLNEPHATTFINYLRVCMENCGFSRIAQPDYGNDYEAFFEKVKPRLKMI